MADWKPPIAYVDGHLPGCYDAAGNYRSCADVRCPAAIAWGSPDVRGRAYADHDADERERAALNGRPDPHG